MRACRLAVCGIRSCAQGNRIFATSIRPVPSARSGKSGLSQEEFAEGANVHRTYISSVALGNVNVNVGIRIPN
jgi:hypothetical protein